MRIDKNTTIRLGNRNIVKIKIGDVVIWQKSTEPVVGPDYFYIESLGDGNTISVKNVGNTYGVTPTLEYSTDKNTWNTITFNWTDGTQTTELPVKLNTGEKMYFRNDTRKFSKSYNAYITFSSSVSSNVGGDIRTLSNYLDVNNETIPEQYMFYYLFYDNKNIIDASNLRLSYTTLANNCYEALFYGCSSLVNAPALPSTTLANECYSSMFRYCTSLTTAPALPATTLKHRCYQFMFESCLSLTTAPELPATTLATECYRYTFNGCSSLNYIKCLATNDLYNTNDFRDSCESWVNGVSDSGTFIASDYYSKGWYWGENGVPKNWTTKTESGNPFEPSSSGGGTKIYRSGGLTVYEMGISQGGYHIQVNSNVMDVPGFRNIDYCFAMMKISSDLSYGMAASMTPYIGNGVTVYISNEVNDDNNCPFSYNYDDESNNVSYSLTSRESTTQILPYINSGNCIWVKFVKNEGTYESDYPSISMDF